MPRALRIGQYQIGLTQLGMLPLCNVLQSRIDPTSDYQEYTDNGDSDLNGAPIEAGFPTATWHWDRLSQTDYNTLLGFIGVCYINTRKNQGGGATDYATFSAIMPRPKGTFESGEWTDVSADLLMLEAP